MVRGEEAWSAKLDEEKVRVIREAYPDYSIGQIASAFGISQATAHHVITGYTWSHVL